jgi:hypothetical protein
MKRLIKLLRQRAVKKSTLTQEDLLEFVKNKDNVKKAAEGSMQKRIDLINRVELHRKSA